MIIQKKINVAIIGGSGFERLFGDAETLSVGTPYGSVQPLFMGRIAGRQVIFLPRHKLEHSIPPHKINYRANIYSLHSIGVERILATNAVGAINPNFRPGDIIIPHDFVNFTKLRNTTFYDEAPVTHIDFSKPYCPEMRELLINTARKHQWRTWEKAVMACTEGPRFETPAEIEMFRKVGCDIVGMTGAPEAALARELSMCYVTICYASNMAAGMQKRLTATEVAEISKQTLPKIEQLLIETVKALPSRRDKKCPCAKALENARFE